MEMDGKMDALLIEFDLKTGRRAGNINPRDKGLKCYRWQNLDEEDINAKGYVWKSDIPAGQRALEIRVVEDGRDLSQYEGIPGVTVLRGNAAINEALDKYFNQYMYGLPLGEAAAVLLAKAMEEKGLKASDLDFSSPVSAQRILKELHEKYGIKLIRKIKRFEKLPV